MYTYIKSGPTEVEVQSPNHSTAGDNWTVCLQKERKIQNFHIEEFDFRLM